MASVVPIVFRAAGAAPGSGPGSRSPRFRAPATSGSGGPPVIGGLAGLIGLPTALGMLVLLGGAVSVGARATREPQHPKAHRRAGGRVTFVLSDLDGVLVDSRGAIERGWRLGRRSAAWPNPRPKCSTGARRPR